MNDVLPPVVGTDKTEKRAIDFFWDWIKDNDREFYDKYYEGYHKLTGGLSSEEWKKVDNEFQKWLEKEKRKNTLKVTNYLENVQLFWEEQPFFYDKSGIFWFWNKYEYKWEIVDDVDVMNAIEKDLGMSGMTIKSVTKANYLEAFKRWGRRMMPKQPPKTWIQFKNVIFDIERKKFTKATPEFFICNPIPWKVSNTPETPTMDKLFKDWVGKEYVQTLYEIIAYCCLIDYPIHLIFCFIGVGRNGKTKYQQLLTKFIGNENCTSTELDALLESRFESAKLYKKLVCTLGETNFGIMSKTSLLKRLVGQDLIGYEFKRKNPFDDYNYAKILINSNSLPSSEDTSEGFYRRWFIIDFPNTFPEGKDILLTIPEEEYNNLAKKVTLLLPRLVETGKFSKQGTIEARKRAFIMASNPLPMFLEKCCTAHVELYVRHSELYTAYCKFLAVLKRRRVSKREFNIALLDENFEARRTTKNLERDFYVEGLGLNRNWEEELTVLTGLTQDSQLNILHKELKLDFNGNVVKSGNTNKKNIQKEQLVYKKGYWIDTSTSKKTQKNLNEHTMKYNNLPQKEANLPTLMTDGDEGIIPESCQELGTRNLLKTGEVKKDFESLQNTISILPEDNSIFIDEHFDIDFIKKCLREGLIAEYRKGTYTIVR